LVDRPEKLDAAGLAYYANPYSTISSNISFKN